ncbi:hypothetical protein [Halalkalibaculum sp. DA384]|uniref:hypothetical protein n=1 Tax=Halalkalibaculum sp. DA384 TaxID=3373606 RepID=UPI0037544BAE
MNSARTTRFIISILTICVLSTCDGLLDSTNSRLDTIDWREGAEIVPAPEDSLSAELQQAYRQDAEKLAIRYVNNSDSTETAIPSPLIDRIYNGLVHVAASGHPKANEVTEDYQIHAQMPSHPRQVVVHVDTTAPWIGAWKNGAPDTGNEQIDMLMEEFNLEPVSYQAVESTPNAEVKLQSDKAINVFAVGRQFRTLDYIVNAGSEGITDGNEIDVLFFSNHLRYYYTLGFGDCPSGCINSHVWVFDVYSDGTVQFVGEEGDPLENIN